MRVRSLKLPEVREVEGYFAYNCTSLVSLELPKLEKAGGCFALGCPSLPPHAEGVLPGKIATTFGKETTKYEDDNLRRSGGPRV